MKSPKQRPKKEMAISKKAMTTLRDIYLGDSVILYLKDMNVVIPTGDGNMDISPMLQGIVMDVDETFIHLGNGDMVQKSVYHENVGMIESLIVDDALINFDMPERDSEIN